MYITINGVQYTAEDIKKATAGSVVIDAPARTDFQDDRDWFTFEDIQDAYVFKTQGKLKLVAMPPAGNPPKKFKLINKHQLKKTHALYSEPRPAEMGMLRDHFQRPQRSQGRRW